MNLILLGAPGSGKGTQAKKINRDFGLIQISTGDILRENIKNNTELGKQAKQFMDNGALVPDELIIELIKERLRRDDVKNGVMFDGFPRTVKQAEELEKIAEIDAVIMLDVPFDEIERRLEGRRACVSCGAIFNTSFYSEQTCDKCGAPLYQRDDDKLETVRNRLKVYENQTAPLIDFYKDRLQKFVGMETSDETYQPIYNFLKKVL